MGEELCWNHESTVGAIDSSNIGYRLLKKHGWQEGTGLGASQQGRLEPVEAHLKTNKRGLGADKFKKRKLSQHSETQEQAPPKAATKAKPLSKRMKKLLAEEKRSQEREFEKAFFRLFWPDNV